MGHWAALVKFACTLVSFAAFWNWETYRPLVFNRPHRWLHARRNLAMALFNTVVLAIVVGVPLASVVAWAIEKDFGLLRWLQLNPWLNLVITIVILDAWMYVWHRMNHTIPFLWRFHRMHHSDHEMDVTTATRFHLGEHLFGSAIRLLLIPLLGTTLTGVLIYESIVVVVTMFHHANISLGRFDRILRAFLVTPRMHQIHHSRQMPETNSNYSVVFSFWDRIGKSFRMRASGEAIPLGLEGMDDERWQTIDGMLKTPFR